MTLLGYKIEFQHVTPKEARELEMPHPLFGLDFWTFNFTRLKIGRREKGGYLHVWLFRHTFEMNYRNTPGSP